MDVSKRMIGLLIVRSLAQPASVASTAAVSEETAGTLLHRCSRNEQRSRVLRRPELKGLPRQRKKDRRPGAAWRRTHPGLKTPFFVPDIA
jgi:hypothetical protein